MPRFRTHLAVTLQILLALTYFSPLSLRAKARGIQLVKTGDMKEWLTVLSSDEYEGRNTFTESLGISAAYIAGQLKSWGVKPGGDNGSYYQRVRVLGVKSLNKATITVEANGQTRTFKVGEAFSLPANLGSKRAFTSDQIEFVGYGFSIPAANYSDYSGRDVKGKVVVFLGTSLPKSVDQSNRRLMFRRASTAIEQKGAIAAIGPAFSRPPSQASGQQPAAPAAGQTGGGMGFGPPIEKADFTTVQKYDFPVPPSVSAQDEFYEFLFSGQEATYAQLKARANDREPLAGFALKNVKITFNLDVDYRVVRTQFTRNVVGIVEGRDPQLRKTYVAFGAHYDHVGYSEGEIVQTSSGTQRPDRRGRVKEGTLDDRYWNGADDDGSGTVAIMAIAKAFALGQKSRRSMLFVWHTGEEKGLYGSRFFADYPTVPLESIVAQINLDMVGRNRNDKSEEANSVYLIGDDRISTELHNLTVDANSILSKPLKLDYEMNDPADPEQFYFRSDHYSYAAKGIPVVFLTTGLHPDYHSNSDSVDKINFEKMTRISQLAYVLGERVGNLEHPPVRDNRGPRAGKGSSGKLD